MKTTAVPISRSGARLLAVAWACVVLAGAGIAVARAQAPVAAPAAPPAASSSTLPRVPPPADLPRDRPLRAGFLIVDGVYGSELVAPFDVLQHATAHAPPGIDAFTVSPDGAQVKTAEGLTLQPRYGFANAPALDILVVPSAVHSMDSDLGNEALIAWIAKMGKGARYVVSLCDGAFLIAKAGVTVGRLVTTFPADQDRFAQMFPALELRRGVSFVHDGPLLTSVGGARSYDAALYLVDHLYGEQVAKDVAKGLVLPWPPGEDEAPLPALVIRYSEVKKK